MEINNLSKDLGLRKIGPLKFKEDDNLYKKFQKLTKYIYKNGEWNSQDIQKAIKKMFEYRVRKKTGRLEKIPLDDPRIPSYRVTEGFQGECYEYSWDSSIGAIFRTYVFVDQTNHSGAKHAKRFNAPNIFGRIRKISRNSIYDKEGMMFNVDRLVGFNKAEEVLLQGFKEQKSQLDFKQEDLEQYLRMLVDPALASKKYAGLFTKNNRHYGAIADFIEGYIDNVYEIVVQHDYEKKLESQFRADPSTTKLNINEETQRAMNNTELKQYFSFVELDNEVDLKRFKDFETEMHRVQSVLPTVEGIKPDLRLRKLGNYKALGLYFSFNKTITLDFRSGSTKNRGEYRPSQPGIQAFVHEYGHYLDYNLSKDKGIMSNLSLEPEFKKIIDKYVEQLKVNGIYDYSHGKIEHYYAVPTEVFARSFEVYAFEKGLRSSLMKRDYNRDLEYVSFTPEIKEEITKYFDEKAPGFSDRIRLLVEKEKVEEQRTDKSHIKNEDTKKEGREYTPYLEQRAQGNGLPEQEDLFHKFDRPSIGNSSISDEYNVVENSEKGVKKEGPNYTPYLQSETEGNGLPVQDNLDPEFHSPPTTDFNMDSEKVPRRIRAYHVANSKELSLLNQNSKKILEVADFYNDKLSEGFVHYIYKQDNKLKDFKIKYGKENFAHLLGIKFANKTSKQILEDLVNRRLNQEAIFVKNDGTTFKKLNVIESLKKITDSNTIALNDLGQITQASKLKFNDALKTSDNNLLLAIKDFEPELFRPYSLMNLKNARGTTLEYLDVPENTVLAVLAETRSEFGGVSIGTLSINHDYVKSAADTMEIIDIMNKLSIRKLEEIEQSQEKSNEEKLSDESIENLVTERNKEVSKQQKISAKEIDYAKSEKILAVAQHLGIQLISDKGKYYWEQEPSFVIDPKSNLFKWADREIYHGDPVTLVKEIKRVDFNEAVKYLNENQIDKFDIEKVKYRLKNQSKAIESKQVTTEKQGHHDTDKTSKVPKRVSKEQIIKARNRNILEVAQNLGINLRKTGQTYVWTEHDSFVIFPKTNTYSWFSKDEVGKNPIDLVQSFNGADFKQAVAYLNDIELSSFDEAKIDVEPQKPFKYLLRDSSDVSKLKDYFENERGISQSTVRDFLQSGVIAQANRIHQNEFEPVVVFKHRDSDGNIVGASLQGIKENYVRYPTKGRLKEIISNSKRNWGITYNCGIEPNEDTFKLIFFEAPIDLMSYYELHKDNLEGTRLVAMNGLKENTIGNHLVESFGFKGTLQKFNDTLTKNGLTKDDVLNRLPKIKLAVDNDAKGREFVEKMQRKYPLVPFEAELPPMLEGREKTDWNDYLKAKKTGNIVIDKPQVEKETQKEIEPKSQEQENNEIQKFSLENATAKEVSNHAMELIREFSRDPAVWDEYMTMLGNFSGYSPRNVALIYEQAKDAKMVGTYNEWQMRHEQYKLTKEDIVFDPELAKRYEEKGQEIEQKLSIKAGEKGKITLFKVAKEWRLPRTDEQGNVILDSEGKIKYKKYHATQLTELEKSMIKEEKIKPIVFPKRDKQGKFIFQKYKVFDIEQTNLKKESYGKVVNKHQYDYEAESSKLYKISYALKNYAKNNHIDYRIDKRKLTGLPQTVKGIYQNDGKSAKVLMNKNLDFKESLGTAIRLLSHAAIDNQYQGKVENFHRGLEAEIVGHAVAAHFGLPTEKRFLKEMSARLQKLSDKELTKSLNRAFSSSSELINQIAKYSETPKRERDRRTTKKQNQSKTRSI